MSPPKPSRQSKLCLIPFHFALPRYSEFQKSIKDYCLDTVEADQDITIYYSTCAVI